MLRLALPLLFIVVACGGTRANVVEAPTVVNVAPVASGQPRTDAPAPKGGGQLKLHLGEEAISKSSPGCYLDEQITTHDGILTYDADGDGAATAVFGPQHYEGTIHNGELELHLETELDWEQDGCHWGTTAIIRGRVDGKLVWTYEDRVMTGTNCSGVCHASATFETVK